MTKPKQMEGVRIINLIRQKVKYNKKSVTIDISTWRLIETIIENIRLKSQ